MNLQPTLEDHRVLIRPLQKDDFEGLYKVAKDPLIWEQHPCPDRYKKEVYAEFFDASIQSGGALAVIEKSSTKIIGSSRFKQVDNAENAIEIGWSFLSRDKWGGEYNGSMKHLMIDHAFESMEYIVLYIGKDNIRSQKAAEKIGGIRIHDQSLKHLMTKSETDWTYCIKKDDWLKN